MTTTKKTPPARPRTRSVTPEGPVMSALVSEPDAPAQAASQADVPAEEASTVSKVVPQAAAAPPVTDLAQVRVRRAARSMYSVQFNSRLAPDVAAAVEEHRITTSELNVDLLDRALRIVLAEELARLAGPGSNLS